MPRQKRAVVALNGDGTVAGRWESMYALCKEYGKDNRWFRDSCQTGRLYLGRRWMWEDDYNRAVREKRKDELVYSSRVFRRRIAFTSDFRGRDDNELVFLFKGATKAILRTVFDQICGGRRGLAAGYDIREGHDVAQLWRHCYWRLEVWMKDFKPDSASISDINVLIAARLRAIAEVGDVKHLEIDDFLNMTGTDNNNNNNKNKTMPKIYVRVPGYVAGFWRGRNEDRHLNEFEPYELNDYLDLYMFLEHHLRLIPEQNQNVFCYSERAWTHILHGKAPGGGRQILNRNPEEWPKMSEVCALTGKFVTDKQEAADYLCIAIPPEILDGGRLHRTNGSYALPKKEAERFIGYLKQEFRREFEAFFREDERICMTNDIRRSDVDRMERFLAAYNMPISVDSKDREALRKLMFRLRRRKNLQPYLRQGLDPFVEHISQDDLEKTERYKKKMEREEKRHKKES